MITQSIINFFTNIAVAVIDLFPTWTLPEWYTTTIDFWNDAFTIAEGFRVWIPFDAIQNTLVFLMSIYAVVLGIRVGRILLSLFTGGGGSAA